MRTPMRAGRVFVSSWLGFRRSQRHEILDDVGQLVRRQFASIRRHWRLLDETGLPQARDQERPQFLLRIDHLDRVAVAVEEPTGDNRAVACDDAERPILGLDLGSRIQKRTLQFLGAAELADVAQVGARLRTVRVDAMARETRPFAFEYRLYELRISRNGSNGRGR